MKKNRISTASLVARIREMWADDIQQLDTMLESRSDDHELYSFIDSLRLAKAHLLAKLPYANDSNKEIPIPPTSMALRVVRSRTKIAVLDRVKLPKILCQIEKDQFKYMQESLLEVGLPDGITTKLENVLATYRSVVEQLERSFKTQQLKPVVVR